MKDLNSLRKFRTVNSAFPDTDEIRALKNSGRKVFGWFCTYVPEEIIQAAGALPVRITGHTRETELEDGNAYLYVNNCSFSRSCFQLGIRGQYNYLDGVIGGSTCDGARRLFDLWRYYLKPQFSHVLTVPRKFTESAHTLYLDQIQQMTVRLEEYLGTKITDTALINSINLYNESRRMLTDLYELRKRDNPPITGAEILEVMNASFRMPRETFNTYLNELLDEVKASNRQQTGRSRLLIAGSVLNNPEFIASIEETGGLVVADELCSTTRYWSDPVILETGKSPLEAIARRYLDNFPCARMSPSEERFRRIGKLVKDYRVEGVVSEIIRYCVPYAHDVPMLTDYLKIMDVPVLSLDIEYGSSGSGQIRTRVQAFLEMLEGRRR